MDFGLGAHKAPYHAHISDAHGTAIHIHAIDRNMHEQKMRTALSNLLSIMVKMNWAMSFWDIQ